MKEEIEKAIRETLVITNPQSIHIAVDKIIKSIEPKWINAKENLPKNGQNVLAIIFMDDKFYIPFTCVYDNDKFRNENDDELDIEDYTHRISHWMPLPSNP